MRKFPGKLKLIVLILAGLSLLFFAVGCEPEPDVPDEEVEEEEADVEVGGVEGVVDFDPEYDVPEIAGPHDYTGLEGHDEIIMAATGDKVITISPEGEYLAEVVSPGIGYFDFPRLSPDASRFVIHANYDEWAEPWETMLLFDEVGEDVEEYREVDYEGQYLYYPVTWIDNSTFIHTVYDEDWLANIYYKDVDAGESGVYVDLAELPINQEVVETSTVHPDNPDLVYFLALGEGDEHYSLFEYDRDADELEALWEMDHAYTYGLNVAPDGTIAVTAGTGISEEPGEFHTFGVYMVDPDTGEAELFYQQENLQAIWPEFSPDGNHIAVCTDTRSIDVTWSIHMFDIAAQEGEVFTRYPYDSLQEPFSPSWETVD